jgi:hypothetical protein
MKALALIPDSSAEVISGGFQTNFNVGGTATSGFLGTSNVMVKQTNNVGSTGVAVLAIGKGKFKF